jgi:hypothetical protein
MRAMSAILAAVFIAGVFTAAAAAAEKAPSSRAVRRVVEDEKPTGRMVGQIKLPERPTLQAKLPESVKVEAGAKLPEVRLKSMSLLDMSGSRDPIAEVEINDEGRFAFEGVPAGPVRLRPNFEVVAWDAPEASRTFSLGQSFTLNSSVRAGETTEVAFFGRGRPVTGKILLPEGIKPGDATVRLTMVDPPWRAMWGRQLDQRRPTPLAVAFGRVKPDRELESQPLDADGGFRVEAVPEGTYRLHVTIRGQKEPTQVWFRGYAAGQAEWVKNGMFDVPLMKNGTSEAPLDLGAPRFERLPKAG